MSAKDTGLYKQLCTKGRNFRMMLQIGESIYRSIVGSQFND